MGGKRQDEYLRVSIDLPAFRLDLKGLPTTDNLKEIRKIVEMVGADDIEPLDEAHLFELKSRLSEEFFKHKDLMSRVKSSFVLDEDIRVLKQVIPLDSEYDLDKGEESLQMNVVHVKSRIARLFNPIDIKKVRECLVHIRGELSRDQQCLVMDTIKQRAGISAITRFFSTPKNLEGNVLVEAVCFGEGIAPDSEW